jgi:hypothetical protein
MNILTTHRASLPSLLACGLLALVPSVARADIQTTTQTLMPAMGDKPFSTTITSTRKNAQRVETTMSIAGAEQRTVTLTLCDKKVTYTLDPSLKIYYSTSLVMPADDEKPEKSTAKRTTGKITTTLLGVKDLGERTIGAYKTRGYEITLRNQTSGCLGASDITTKQEFWTAPAEAQGGDGFACGEASAASGTGDGCDASMERKGDKALWALYTKVMSGLRVSTRFALEGEGAKDSASETRLLKVSRAKLPDSLFAIPKGFRLLSAKEFQAEQSKAMMQKMMQQGATDDDQDDDDATEENEPEAEEATDEE